MSNCHFSRSVELNQWNIDIFSNVMTWIVLILANLLQQTVQFLFNLERATSIYGALMFSVIAWYLSHHVTRHIAMKTPTHSCTATCMSSILALTRHHQCLKYEWYNFWNIVLTMEPNWMQHCRDGLNFNIIDQHQLSCMNFGIFSAYQVNVIKHPFTWRWRWNKESQTHTATYVNSQNFGTSAVICCLSS